MAKTSTRTTGNDKPADPGGTKPAKAGAEKSQTKTTVQSGDRNKAPSKSGTRITKK